MVSTPIKPGDSARTTGRRAPAVLVVLVVRDGESWLRECLRGLSQQTYPRLGVIAVDNGSTDGSRELLLRALGEERVLELKDNPGLPAAVRAALQLEAASGADYVLIHHDDVALDPEAITRMVEVAERIDGVGVVGPKVVDWDDPNILREVGLSTDRFGYPYSPLEQDEIDHGQYDRVREVLFVSSTAMLVSRGALDRAGLPDERFSSSREDLDFCWRVRLAGFRVVMTPLARARHRSATDRGERSSGGVRDRRRYDAERASLAAMLKNYGFLSLLWILPLYAIQGLVKLVLWAVERRFEEVWQVLRAWWWNVLHLPGTIRRRVRAQSVRAVPDRSVRRYMAPATVRLRRWADVASTAVLGREGRAAPEPSEDLEQIEEPAPMGRRVFTLARAHPVATAWVLFVVVGAFAVRHLIGGGTPEGGALQVPPHDPSDYFRELLSSVRTTALGGAQAASPALGFLGVLSAVLGTSTVLAAKALLIGLPPLASVAFYRTFVRQTGERGPAVAGAVCYGLSSLLLWGFSEGRIPVLVLLAALPFLAGRVHAAFATTGVRPRQFVAGTAMVLAAAVAFYPGAALAAGLVLAAWVLVPGPGERRLRGAGLLAAVVVCAGLLILPQAIELMKAGGHGLTSAVGRPSFTALLRLAPDGGPGSWTITWFLPIAALLSFTLVEGPIRPAARFLMISVAAVFLAWASASGHLPAGVSNPAAYLAAAALGYSALVSYGLASALPRMGRHAFGYRQLAVGVVVVLLLGGVGLQAVLAAKGDWAVGSDKLPAAWTLVDPEGRAGQYRVLWLGRLSGDPLTAPGGDPITTLRVGDISLRYALTDRHGSSALDTGRDQHGAGYQYVEDALADIVSGATVHGGALLAPLNVRFVVAAQEDLPRTTRRRLGQQVDLDLVPTIGLTIFRNLRSLPEAAYTNQERYVNGALKGPSDAAALPAIAAPPLPAEPGGGFAGPVPGPGAVLLSDQFDEGWRAVMSSGSVKPEESFGWAMRFPVTSAGRVELRPPPQTARRVEIALIAVLWLAGLWITRRPSRA